MAVRIKPIALWRVEVDQRPGALARILEPLATLKADLKVVIGYPLQAKPGRAAVELHPVRGARVAAAARAVGLREADTPSLLVEADNRPGLAHAIATRFAGAGINLTLIAAQVSDRRVSVVIRFDNAADAGRAVLLIKQAATALGHATRKAAARGRTSQPRRAAGGRRSRASPTPRAPRR